MENIEIISSDSLSLITKAEIDVQISTAKAYPRSLKESIDKAMSMATISQEVAESCSYALPRAGKNIEGPSVRLAEIVAASFGNIRTGARVIANDGKTITAQGICHDLESNNCVTVEVKRKITNKKGQTFNEDMQVVTGNAACAIAFRNALFKVVPSALLDGIYEKIKLVAKGDASTLKERRGKAIKWFNDKGVKNNRICEVLGVKKVDDIDLDLLQTLRGFTNAVVTDGADLHEIFKTTEEIKTEEQKRIINFINKCDNQKELDMLLDSLPDDLKEEFKAEFLEKSHSLNGEEE